MRGIERGDVAVSSGPPCCDDDECEAWSDSGQRPLVALLRLSATDDECEARVCVPSTKTCPSAADCDR